MTAFKLMDYSGVEYAALADMPTESSFTVIAKASGRASHYSVGSTLYNLSESLKVERGQSYVFNLEQKTLANSIVYDTNLTLKKCLKNKPFEQNNKKQCFVASVLNNALNKKCFKQKDFYIKALDSSPIRGGDGNIEYVSYFSNKDNDIKSINIEEIVKKAFKEQKSK